MILEKILYNSYNRLFLCIAWSMKSCYYAIFFIVVPSKLQFILTMIIRSTDKLYILVIDHL